MNQSNEVKNIGYERCLLEFDKLICFQCCEIKIALLYCEKSSMNIFIFIYLVICKRYNCSLKLKFRSTPLDDMFQFNFLFIIDYIRNLILCMDRQRKHSGKKIFKSAYDNCLKSTFIKY